MRSSLTCLFVIYSFGANLILATTASGQKPGEKSPVIAEIGETKILRSDLETEALAQIGFDLPTLSRKDRRLIKSRILDRMIDRALLLEAAKRFQTTRQIEVDSKLSPKESEALLIEQYLQSNVLSDIGVYPSHSASAVIREDLSTSGISPEVVNQDRQTAPWGPGQAAEYRIREIFLALPDGAPDDQVRAVENQAARIGAAARENPERFAEFVKRYSNRTAKGRRGAQVYVTANQLDPAIAEIVSKSTIGQITAPVRTPQGLHIIKIDDLRSGYQDSPAQLEKLLNAAALQRLQDEALETHLEELRKEIKVVRYLD